jgi:osmotically-inducible protein OsmY
MFQHNVSPPSGVVNGVLTTTEDISMQKTLLTLAGACLLASTVAMADERTAGAVIDDTTVTAKVKAALIADPLTKAYQISVNTFKGTVKLSGFVDSAEAKSRAVQVADGIDGAAVVESDLEVRQ